jgi:predicted transcriptional regulator
VQLGPLTVHDQSELEDLVAIGIAKQKSRVEAIEKLGLITRKSSGFILTLLGKLLVTILRSIAWTANLLED